MIYSFTSYNVFKAQIPFIRQNIGKMAKENDFLALQEWIDNMKVHSEAYIAACPTFKLLYKNVYTGTATISNHKAIESAHFISHYKEFGFLTKKSMLKTKYRVSGHSLSIFNLHSLNFVTNRMWKENIDMWLAQVEETGPAIFGGDMNTWNSFRFDYVDEALKKKGFSYAEYKEFTMLALDHLWTRDINVISSVCDTNIHTSDHYPVTIRFTFGA